VASYAYDYLGRRISRTIYGAPNVTVRYAYDGARILAEYDGSGTLLRKFVYGPGLDEPICLIDVANGNAAYYYHLDGLGSVVALSNVNKVLVERYAYDVFGRPTIRDPNGVVLAASARGNPYLFTGRAYDAESGLYYYRARYYDYATGRFLQPDPTGYGDGLNLYSYCANNPFNFSDPSGLCKESIFDRLDRVMDVVGPYALPVTLTCLSILYPPAGVAILGFMGGMNIGEAAFTGTDLYGNPLSTSQRLYRGGVGTLEVGLSLYGAAQIDAAVQSQAGSSALKSAAPSKASPAASEAMTGDQQALKQLIDEATRGGRKPLSASDAETIMDWAQEYKYPGFRASPGDVGVPSNWTANPQPHIHIPGAGRRGHVLVEPGVQPR
jgi:RHS repeat-associated protein